MEKQGLKHTVDPKHLREAYFKNLEVFRDGLTKGCHRNRISLVPMVTDQPYADGLGAFLAARNKIRRPVRI